jgi:hypothetical protein
MKKKKEEDKDICVCSVVPILVAVDRVCSRQTVGARREAIDQRLSYTTSHTSDHSFLIRVPVTQRRRSDVDWGGKVSMM